MQVHYVNSDDHAYIISKCGLKIKAAMLEKIEIEADS